VRRIWKQWNKLTTPGMRTGLICFSHMKPIKLNSAHLSICQNLVGPDSQRPIVSKVWGNPELIWHSEERWASKPPRNHVIPVAFMFFMLYYALCLLLQFIRKFIFLSSWAREEMIKIGNTFKKHRHTHAARRNDWSALITLPHAQRHTWNVATILINITHNSRMRQALLI